MNSARSVGFARAARWIVLAFALAGAVRAAELVDVRRIWNEAHHNAFTDLIRWHDRWWCSFRESTAHVGGDGGIRLLESVDGLTWTSAALIKETDIDLRDPKLSITPDGKLMINCGGSVYLGTKQLKGRRSRVMFSADGHTWTAPAKVLDEGEWLWRVVWHEGVAYGAAYRSGATLPGGGTDDMWSLAVYSSRDALTWAKVADLAVDGRPNETTLRFADDGTMIAWVRREGGDQVGWIGHAAPPYRSWSWAKQPVRLGGPNFIAWPDGGWMASTRGYTGAKPGSTKGMTTLLARINLKGDFDPVLTLPSDGDTSYAGLVRHEGLLWVSYYSSHEGKSGIYIARVKP
jgi:hypothetical protein